MKRRIPLIRIKPPRKPFTLDSDVPNWAIVLAFIIGLGGIVLLTIIFFS